MHSVASFCIQLDSPKFPLFEYHIHPQLNNCAIKYVLK